MITFIIGSRYTYIAYFNSISIPLHSPAPFISPKDLPQEGQRKLTLFHFIWNYSTRCKILNWTFSHLEWCFRAQFMLHLIHSWISLVHTYLRLCCYGEIYFTVVCPDYKTSYLNYYDMKSLFCYCIFVVYSDFYG